ncbi:MAG: hypothetical protein Mars2KO_31690 [Maribacter sp.]
MKNGSFLFVAFLLVFSGCKNTPKPIAYGADGCNFCSMTIVDRQHAAQYMTQKGRSYAFDATECMLNQLKTIDAVKVGLYLVNDYDTPGEMIDATQATYLISENIPSPMGEYLTAFATREAAQKAHDENGGTLYTWEQLNVHFN